MIPPRSAARVSARGRQKRRGWIAFFAIASLLATAGALGSPSTANATDYPTYADVQNARNSEAAKQAEIAVVNQLLVGLADRVTSSQAVALQAGADAEAAQLRYDNAAHSAALLESRAAEAKASAQRSRNAAGAVAVALAQSDGSDLSTRLFFNGDTAANLLAGLGLANIVKSQSAGVYVKAIQEERSAGALTAQADRARQALKVLADASQAALQVAAADAQAAAAALVDQQTHQVELNAQLATLTAATAVTETDYSAGVAAAKAAAAAAAAAANQAAPSVGTGQVSSSGWTRPSAGHISSPYGYRIDPYNGVYQLHEGTDLAPGCNSPIYAAHSGTVVLAGPYGGYGNYIRIQNSGDSSYETAYGHIVSGGILVQVGETVTVGQNIARVGSTGMSTGCHLHFEIHHNGATQDPVPFMRSQGVELSN